MTTKVDFTHSVLDIHFGKNGKYHFAYHESDNKISVVPYATTSTKIRIKSNVVREFNRLKEKYEL